MKKKLSFFAIIMCLAFSSLQAQQSTPTIQWQKCFGGYGDDKISNTIAVADGYVTCGGANGNSGNITGNHGSDDIWVVKTNFLGTIQWQKSFGGTDYDVAGKIIQTSDGGYAIVGSVMSNNGNVTGNHGTMDAWVVKISSTGVLQWQKTIGGTNYDYGNSIVQTSDGGYAIAGNTYSNDGNITGNSGWIDAFVTKLTSTGTVVWTNCNGGSANEVGVDIKESLNGSLFMVGYSESTDIIGCPNYGIYDGYVVKVSSAGVTQWQKCFGGNSYEEFTGLVVSGNFIVATGYTSSNNNGNVSGNHSNGYYDVWVVKISQSNGSLTNQHCYGSLNDDGACGISVSPNGGYLVAAYTYGGGNGNISSLNHGGSDTWVFELSSNFSLIWEKSMGGSNYETGYSICSSPNGGYIVGSKTQSPNDGDVTGNHSVWADYWVVKLIIPTPMPVELLSFTAKTEGLAVNVSWQTLTEINNDYFEIQRSQDGQSWIFVGTTLAYGNGNSTNSQTYGFLDENPLIGTSYYRLKQVDVDGKSIYSSLATVTFNNLIQIKVGQDENSIYLYNLPEHSIVRLYSLEGKLVFEGSESIIGTGNLSKGVYILNIIFGGSLVYNEKIRIY